MDPELHLDDHGDGYVLVYRYGKTWRLIVTAWVVEPLSYQPPDNPMNRAAQREVALLKGARVHGEYI